MEKIEKRRMSIYYLLSKFLSDHLALMTRQDVSKNKTEVRCWLLCAIESYPCPCS